MRRGLVVANTILVFPFVYIFFSALLVTSLDKLGLGGSLNSEVLGTLFGVPAFLAYFFLPTIGPVLLPLVTAFTGFSLWKNWSQDRALLIGCLLVFMIYDIYLIWWYATGQHMEL